MRGKTTSGYSAWLLRVYAADGGWQATLECPRCGERIGFRDPQQLLAFIVQAKRPASAVEKRR